MHPDILHHSEVNLIPTAELVQPVSSILSVEADEGESLALPFGLESIEKIDALTGFPMEIPLLGFGVPFFLHFVVEFEEVLLQSHDIGACFLQVGLVWD